MNRRILKKLSKRAALLLPALMPRHHNATAWFLADREGCYHGMQLEPKHGKAHKARFSSRLYNPHPLKGTPMTGGMDSGETPEWWEKTLWEVFTDVVWWTSVDDFRTFEDTGWPALRPDIVLKTPADYLRQARLLIAEGKTA